MNIHSHERSRAMITAALQKHPKDVHMATPLSTRKILYVPLLLLPCIGYMLYAAFTGKTNITALLFCVAVALLLLAVLVKQWTLIFACKRKGFYLHANAQGIELYSTPLIPWSAVQSIDVLHDQYGQSANFCAISITLSPDWLNSNPIPSRVIGYTGFRKNLGTDTDAAEQSIEIVLSTNSDKTQALVAAEEIRALRRAYCLRFGKWSPKIIQLIQQHTNEKPEDHLYACFWATQRELAKYAEGGKSDTGMYMIVDDELKHLDAFFRPHGGYWSEMLEEKPNLFLVQKPMDALDKLLAIENRTPEQDAQVERLFQEIDRKNLNGGALEPETD